MTPDHRHALGCLGGKNSRHNGKRNCITTFAGEAGQLCVKEVTLAKLADLTGAEPPAATAARRAHRGGDDAESDDEEETVESSATAAPKRKNCERPCDIVILHRISDAPSTTTAYDVTYSLPDSKKGLGGMKARGEDGPDFQRALTSARARKDKNRGGIEVLRSAYEPLCFSTNGRPDEQTIKVLSGLAKDWALAHGGTPGEAMRELRKRMSLVTHRWNGEILKSLCASPSEGGSEEVGSASKMVPSEEDEVVNGAASADACVDFLNSAASASVCVPVRAVNVCVGGSAGASTL